MNKTIKTSITLLLALTLTQSAALAADAKGIKTITTQDKGEKYTFEKTNTVIQVAPHSEVKIDFNSSPESIELVSGMARARVQKLAQGAKSDAPKFILKTKSATMGVRGTDFLGVVTPVLGEAEIIVFEGNVDFASTSDVKDVKHVPAGHWGGIGGRFGAKTHDLIALPKAALDYFDNASKIQ